jgi:RES domain-containing protein
VAEQALVQLAASSRPLHTMYQRAMPNKHASDPLGRKRPIRPGRFNVAKGARVLYLGDDAVTCLHEAQLLGLPPQAVIVVPVQCQLAAVVDLRLPKVQKLLQTTAAEINANFRTFLRQPAPSQALGEACATIRRIDGLLYASSARPGHHNLAVLEHALTPLRSRLIVSDPSGLSDTLP